MLSALLQQAQQPEALRLAELCSTAKTAIYRVDAEQAAAELRRLHTENEALRAELAKPAQEPLIQAMSEVADTFAHKLALDLECVLSDCTSSKWYDTAMNTLSDYRAAMNAIHEIESPTFMGEPVMPPCDDDKEYLK